MTPVQRAVRVALGWVALERQRARRAAAVAARHEESAVTDPPDLREFHRRLAETHRQAERRHYTAARVHESFANRLRLQGADGTGVLRVFMSAVAEAAHADGAAMTFFGPDTVESLAAASDERAKAAQDLEFALGEGPAHASVKLHRAVWARDGELGERWPAFGPAVMDIGVRELVAVPVELSGNSLGALTVFDPRGPVGEAADGYERLQVIAKAFSQIVFDARGAEGRRRGDLAPLLAEADDHAKAHQASGIVAAQLGCTPAQALSLIRAHAYVEGTTLESVARDVIMHRLRLDRGT